MPGTDPTPEEIAVLDDAVAEAGAVVMRYFGREPKTWEKPGEGPVSEADFAANEVLETRLRGAFPDHGWLSEESVDDPARLTCERVWIVDPIDGTRAFIEGRPHFTICAALAVGGEVVAGVVLNPARDEAFAAVRGKGATRKGEPLVIDTVSGFDAARILCTKGTLRPAKWIAETPPGGEQGYVNSIAYRVCKAATEKWDATIALNRLSEWDLAAAQIVFEEAGGIVTNRAGAPIRYNAPEPKVAGLVAAAAPLHGELVRRLAPPE